MITQCKSLNSNPFQALVEALRDGPGLCGLRLLRGLSPTRQSHHHLYAYKQTISKKKCFCINEYIHISAPRVNRYRYRYLYVYMYVYVYVQVYVYVYVSVYVCVYVYVYVYAYVYVRIYVYI